MSTVRDQVFISYSHRDREWLERLQTMLRPLTRSRTLTVWDDTAIQPGARWNSEIQQALSRANVAVLLVTPNFLASEFIAEQELPPLLDAAKQGGLTILWVAVSPSLYEATEITHYQAVNNPNQPLTALAEPDRDAALVKIAKAIQHANTTNTPKAEPPTRAAARRLDDRARLFERISRDWIKGVLQQSLYQIARVEVFLEERSDAVEQPWDLLVQRPEQEPAPPAAGTRVIDLFDSLGGTLLILGAPGSGKTTLLLELARDLLERAGRDPEYYLPIVFNLSSWALRRGSLRDWLVSELRERYDIPLKLGRAWVEKDLVLPLLDGLDEVAAEHRAACVKAVNEFHRDHPNVPLAVCCRHEEYAALQQAADGKLRLTGAVGVQPLSPSQVKEYLARAGSKLQAVNQAVESDPRLWEFLETPLMLSIVLMAYQNAPPGSLAQQGTPEQRRDQLFGKYVEAMFRRRGKQSPYTPAQTVKWLAWVAAWMSQQQQSLFYLENLGPACLPTRWQRGSLAALIVLATLLISAGLAGLIGGVILFALGVIASGLQAGVSTGVLGVAIGVIVGLIIGLVIGISSLALRPQPAEALHWSWGEIRQQPKRAFSRALQYGLVFGSITGLLGGIFLFLYFATYKPGWREVVLGIVILSPLGGVLGALIGFADAGFQMDRLPLRASPNEGVRRSARNSIFMALTVGLLTAVLVVLPLWMMVAAALHYEGNGNAILPSDRNTILTIGLLAGLFAGVLTAFFKGGMFCLHHWCLRLFLWLRGDTPRGYIPFLNYAAERLFLRPVGGGYIFLHRMLLEHFASRKNLESRS